MKNSTQKSALPPVTTTVPVKQYAPSRTFISTTQQSSRRSTVSPTVTRNMTEVNDPQQEHEHVDAQTKGKVLTKQKALAITVSKPTSVITSTTPIPSRSITQVEKIRHRRRPPPVNSLQNQHRNNFQRQPRVRSWPRGSMDSRRRQMQRNNWPRNFDNRRPLNYMRNQRNPVQAPFPNKYPKSNGPKSSTHNQQRFDRKQSVFKTPGRFHTKAQDKYGSSRFPTHSSKSGKQKKTDHPNLGIRVGPLSQVRSKQTSSGKHGQSNQHIQGAPRRMQNSQAYGPKFNQMGSRYIGNSPRQSLPWDKNISQRPPPAPSNHRRNNNLRNPARFHPKSQSGPKRIAKANNKHMQKKNIPVKTTSPLFFGNQAPPKQNQMAAKNTKHQGSAQRQSNVIPQQTSNVNRRPQKFPPHPPPVPPILQNYAKQTSHQKFLPRAPTALSRNKPVNKNNRRNNFISSSAGRNPGRSAAAEQNWRNVQPKGNSKEPKYFQPSLSKRAQFSNQLSKVIPSKPAKTPVHLPPQSSYVMTNKPPALRQSKETFPKVSWLSQNARRMQNIRSSNSHRHNTPVEIATRKHQSHRSPVSKRLRGKVHKKQNSMQNPKSLSKSPPLASEFNQVPVQTTIGPLDILFETTTMFIFPEFTTQYSTEIPKAPRKIQKIANIQKHVQQKVSNTQNIPPQPPPISLRSQQFRRTAMPTMGFPPKPPPLSSNSRNVKESQGYSLTNLGILQDANMSSSGYQRKPSLQDRAKTKTHINNLQSLNQKQPPVKAATSHIPFSQNNISKVHSVVSKSTFPPKPPPLPSNQEVFFKIPGPDINGIPIESPLLSSKPWNHPPKPPPEVPINPLFFDPNARIQLSPWSETNIGPTGPPYDVLYDQILQETTTVPVTIERKRLSLYPSDVAVKTELVRSRPLVNQTSDHIGGGGNPQHLEHAHHFSVNVTQRSKLASRDKNRAWPKDIRNSGERIHNAGSDHNKNVHYGNRKVETLNVRRQDRRWENHGNNRNFKGVQFNRVNRFPPRPPPKKSVTKSNENNSSASGTLSSTHSRQRYASNLTKQNDSNAQIATDGNPNTPGGGAGKGKLYSFVTGIQTFQKKNK